MDAMGGREVLGLGDRYAAASPAPLESLPEIPKYRLSDSLEVSRVSRKVNRMV